MSKLITAIKDIPKSLKGTVFWMVLVIIPSVSFSETVYVKYRGPVDLTPFKCSWIFRSSFINRLCYDPKEQYVIVKLQKTYYHYCEVPPGVVDAWTNADSMGRFYNSFVKGRFDCRTHYIPPYDR